MTNKAGTATTTWNYNTKRGWLDNKRYQDATGPSYIYTPGGKLAKRTWQRGIETAYAYNTFGDLVGVDYSDSATPDVSYVYNRDGRRQQVSDGSGVRTISYDALGQVATESYTSGPLAGLSLNRGTDPLLRKTSLTLEKGGATLWSQGFGYGDASRLASVTMGDDAVQYGYVPNSPLVGSVAFAHSGSAVMTTTKQYDAVNRLTQTSSAVGSTVVSSHQNSIINALDQRKRTDLADGKNWRYEYNSRGELTRGVLYGTNNQVESGMDFQYTYDSSGNRLTHTVTGGATTVTTYTSNLVNQYTNIAAGATATPSYDADGNMTSSGSAYDDRILEYDGENRLTTVRRASDQAVVATYTYDDQSRRVRVQTTSAAPQGAGDVVNVWDGWNLVGELDYTSATGTHQPRRTYAWGLDLSGSEQGAGGIGGLVIQRDATSGDAYFPAYDPNGNLTTLVKASDGTVGASYSYDPYGNLLSSTGAYAATNPFRFSTKYFCPEVDLYYYGYRFYSPVIGRWVNRDPIEERGGRNLYAIVSNDVVNDIDLVGLKEVIDATGSRCEEACLGTVEIRVDSPAQSVAQQIAADPAKRQLIKDVIDRRATLEQLGNSVSTGHTFIYYKYQTGTEEAWGFYPVSQWFGQAGRIVDDLTHPYNKRRVYKVCPKKIDELRKAIDGDKKSPPLYSLADIQCTTWAVGKVRGIGISDLPAEFCEPFTLGENLDKMPAPPNPRLAPKK